LELDLSANDTIQSNGTLLTKNATFHIEGMTAPNATIEIGGSRRALVLTATVVLLLGGAIGWTQLEADNDWIEGFGRTTDISQWVQFADERYRTAHTLEVDLSPAADLAIESPEVLTIAETLMKRLQTLHELGDASSVLDRLRMLNQLLNDNDPAFRRDIK